MKKFITASALFLAFIFNAQSQDIVEKDSILFQSFFALKKHSEQILYQACDTKSGENIVLFAKVKKKGRWPLSKNATLEIELSMFLTDDSNPPKEVIIDSVDWGGGSDKGHIKKLYVNSKWEKGNSSPKRIRFKVRKSESFEIIINGNRGPILDSPCKKFICQVRPVF